MVSGSVMPAPYLLRRALFPSGLPGCGGWFASGALVRVPDRCTGTGLARRAVHVVCFLL